MAGQNVPQGLKAEPSTADLVASTPDPRAERAAELAPEQAPEVDTSGRRFRAIPTHGGTTVSVSTADFASLGVKDHPDVTWDFRKDETTVKVGTDAGEISEEAAKALNRHEPTRFEFIS